jgi:epoxyqueuosine reductase
MLDWVFGCDICQEVCPVNRKADMAEPSVWDRGDPQGNLSSKQPGTGWSPTTGRDAVRNGGLGTMDLVGLLKMTEEEFRQRFRGTPIMRAKWEGMQRNACVALGNLGDPGTVPALAEVLRKGSPLVRGHAAWALGRIDNHEAKIALEFALARETDPEVLREMEWALEEICPTGEVGLAGP